MRMKTTRFLAVPAIAAASMLALSGCFQPPAAPPQAPPQTQAPDPGTGTDETEGTGTGDDAGDSDLAGTTWTGEIGPGFATMDFELNEDGTVDITTWNDGSGFDSPADTWTGDASNLTIVITDLTEQGSNESHDVTFTGTAENGQMSLTGDGPEGPVQLNATEN